MPCAFNNPTPPSPPQGKYGCGGKGGGAFHHSVTPDPWEIALPPPLTIPFQHDAYYFLKDMWVGIGKRLGISQLLNTVWWTTTPIQSSLSYKISCRQSIWSFIFCGEKLPPPPPPPPLLSESSSRCL